jgi:hypothetical protein
MAQMNICASERGRYDTFMVITRKSEKKRYICGYNPKKYTEKHFDIFAQARYDRRNFLNAVKWK